MIMPARNEERLITSAIRSILSQTVRPNRFVIILDECSDRTPNIANSFANRYGIIDVMVASASRYRGDLYKAHRIAELDNRAIKTLDHAFDCIMVANADTVYSAGYIHEALEIMDLESECAITGWNLGGNISGSGIVYRTSFLNAGTGGLIAECANEELYMQMKALSMGYKVIPLKRSHPQMLRPPGHRGLQNVVKDSLRDGYATYTLGFSFIYLLSRSLIALFSAKILQSVPLSLGYIEAMLTGAEKQDVAFTNEPMKIQRRRVAMMLNDVKVIIRKRNAGILARKNSDLG